MTSHKEHAPSYSPRVDDEAYKKKLQILSNRSASVVHMPYPNDRIDSINWDAPEFAIDPDDERWILPPNFDLGASKWYQNLPKREQIRIGMYRCGAQVPKVGSEFEEALIAGIALRNQCLDVDSEEKRYSTHEAEEEQRHILMFNEMAKRTGTKPHGAPNWFRRFSTHVGIVSRRMPVAFWAIVLAGEEPIDHTQRQLIKMSRQGHELHPMLEKVITLHVEEEARHISYADKFQKQHFDKLSDVEKGLFAATLPFILRIAANTILKPSKQDQKAMGIPKDVVKEIWWDSEKGRKDLNDMFSNTARRADILGLRNGDEKTGAQRNKIGQIAWRLAGLNPTK